MLMSIICPCPVGCLSKFLGESTAQGSQEFVHSHMDFRAEVIAEHDGHDHKNAVRDELWKEDSTVSPPVQEEL